MPKKVLVGLSGGVDSAVAAALLLEQGYEVIAGFMKNYADESNPHCHTREDRDMALKVAHHLGIKTCVIFDFRDEYETCIIRYIHEGYQQGITPNPDVLCNTVIKFDLFLHHGLSLGCDAVATGHYARITPTGTHYLLRKGKDNNKDQSYFLAWLDQKQLSQTLFPLGELTKPEVRAKAKALGLPNAERKDSQGLCFIGKVPMKEFLAKATTVHPGPIKDAEGNTLGEHQGALFYTIGQREGLGLSGGPRYVISKDVTTNELIVGHEDDPALWTQEIIVKDRHRVMEVRALPLTATVKLRYRQPDQEVVISQKNEHLMLHCTDPQRAVTPGQIAVVYEGDEVVGSGVIVSSS